VHAPGLQVARAPLQPAAALVARLRKRSYGDPYQCGQLHEHPGDCTWWTPGDYLPPPLMPPWTDTVGRTVLCPVCRSPVCEWAGGPTTVVYGSTGDGTGMGEVREEVRWEFGPCGCEARELVTPPSAPG